MTVVTFTRVVRSCIYTKYSKSRLKNFPVTPVPHLVNSEHSYHYSSDGSLSAFGSSFKSRLIWCMIATKYKTRY